MYRGASWLLARLARRLSATTAVSSVAAEALGSIVQPEIVPNGIDLSSYSAGSKRASGRVIFIGRDDRRKGLDVLLAAWPQIRQRRPQASLHVIGVDRTDVVEGVRYLGRVTEESKRGELGLAEILVTPNRGGESFGIVLLEGLASGCAVVASDLAAFRSVAGEAAAYFDIGDSDGLATTVVGILGSPDRRETLTAAGVARSKRFGRDEVLAGYMAAYELAQSGHR